VKQVKSDGTVTESKTINLVSIISPATVKMTLFPNPAGNVLNLQLTSALQQRVRIEISDVQGRVVQKQLFTAQSGTQTITLNTKFLQPQLYFLYIRDANNKVLTIQKFIRK
jgi:hypothetical protein